MPTMPTLRSRSEPTLSGIILRRPQPGTQIAVGLDEFAQGRDQKPHRDVGDLFGQHVGRVGDDDIVFAGVGGIDVIVADAEGGDDFEFRKQRQRRLVGAHRMVGHRDAADFRGDGRSQPLEVVLGFERMQDELVGKTVVEDRPARPIDQQVDLFRRNIPAAISFPFQAHSRASAATPDAKLAPAAHK